MQLLGTQKVFIFEQFFEQTPAGLQEKRFPLETLMEACSVKKKLLEGTKEANNGLEFENGDVEFTIDELKFIKTLVNSVQEATPTQFETITKLKEILK